MKLIPRYSAAIACLALAASLLLAPADDPAEASQPDSTVQAWMPIWADQSQ
ncbi:hypothetical protein ACIGZJ_27200 [Kitasatospora sp. NPDC052868]|uniref:hypothetical protein n=1 Tax=Kitasatospora sp. NPDC052868 TaxID=3364060 RepID=UPI0037CAE1AC